MQKKTKILIGSALGVGLILLFCCVFLKPPTKPITLQILDPLGVAVEGIPVCAGRYPDGHEPYPAPEVGNTNEDGLISFVPERFGEQTITLVSEFSQNRFMNKKIHITRRDYIGKEMITLTLTADEIEALSSDG